MARGKFIAALAGLCVLSPNFGTARAATIDYNFIGTGRDAEWQSLQRLV
jgi:hypothetical protein